MSELATGGSGTVTDASDRVMRHLLVDRLYHWLTAISVLVLMGSAFLPILGIKFQWLEIHWMTGVLFAALVVFHIVRAIVWQDCGDVMISLFRYSKSIYGGDEQVIGASWDLLPWFVAAGVAFIVIHVIVTALAKARERRSH